MRPLTEQDIRSSFINCSKGEAKRLAIPRDLSERPWNDLDFLGWRDPGAPDRSYLVTERGDRLVGVTLRFPSSRRGFLHRSDVSRSAESAEARLATELASATATRDKLAQLMLDEVQRDARQWQLHGAVLTEVTRILDELDMERRSDRLLEGLDRCTREQSERMPSVTRLRRRLRGLGRKPRTASDRAA
jgi:hypothetical protein